jgi:hypothetical protein
MYVAGEASGRGVALEPSGYENVRSTEARIYLAEQLPGFVVRNVILRPLHAEMSPVDKDLAEALFRLSNEYDIDFPGIGCIAVKNEKLQNDMNIGHTYTTAHIVDGVNMHRDMTKIPLDTVVETMEKIFSYYEDAALDLSGRQYLADISLRQFVYGRTLGQTATDDGEPHAYFVDYDPLLTSMLDFVDQQERFAASQPLRLVTGFGGISGLDNDLYALKENYPDQNFDQIAERLLRLAYSLAIPFKATHAYYCVKGT